MIYKTSRLGRLLPTYLFVVSLFVATAFAASPKEKTLYNFQSAPDGATPVSNLISDKAGNLYGTTYYGGTGNCFPPDLTAAPSLSLFRPRQREVVGGKRCCTVFRAGAMALLPRVG
jgi:hypothetical protein